MNAAAAAAREPTPDRRLLETFVFDLGPWLAAEYVSVHGQKAPRPYPPG